MTSKFFGNSKVKSNSKKEIKKNISNNSKRKAFAVRKTGRGKYNPSVKQKAKFYFSKQ